MIRYGNKFYQRIPGGEIQFGLISHCLRVWFRGKGYTLKKPNYAAMKRYLGE